MINGSGIDVSIPFHFARCARLLASIREYQQCKRNEHDLVWKIVRFVGCTPRIHRIERRETMLPNEGRPSRIGVYLFVERILTGHHGPPTARHGSRGCQNREHPAQLLPVIMRLAKNYTTENGSTNGKSPISRTRSGAFCANSTRIRRSGEVRCSSVSSPVRAGRGPNRRRAMADRPHGVALP